MIITAVLTKRPELSYYQGYHDFASIFYLELGLTLGYQCTLVATRFFIKDFLASSFLPGVIPCMKLLMRLLYFLDEELHQKIEFVEVSTAALRTPLRSPPSASRGSSHGSRTRSRGRTR